MYIKKIAQTPELKATVIDNLNSESSINALSAKQGKVLNEKVDTISEVPVDTIIAYDGDEIPEGYEEVEYDDIKVSLTEPTTNEKVWIQKGKNLFNINKLNVYSVGNASYSVQNNQISITTQAQFSSIDILVKVIPNKQHYISMDVINSIAGRVNVSIYSKDYNTHYIQQWILDSTSGKIGLTFTPNAEEIIFRLYSNAGGEVTNNTTTFSNIQLERGAIPTEYEPYIEKTIWCRNDSGEYEEFYSENTILELKEQIDTLNTRISKGYSELLYSDPSGITADANGNSVSLLKPVTWFSAILIIHANGIAIVNNKLNQYNSGEGMNIWWFNEGYGGTFYNNTIYKVIGICKG